AEVTPTVEQKRAREVSRSRLLEVRGRGVGEPGAAVDSRAGGCAETAHAAAAVVASAVLSGDRLTPQVGFQVRSSRVDSQPYGCIKKREAGFAKESARSAA